MFVILTYDVGEKRVNRVRKIVKKYLTWTQNSVFEGDITESKLHKCLSEINRNTVRSEDSVYIYRVQNSNNIKKDIIGVEKNYDELFL
ncbi:CRISPR-associated endonuclease Cas2 [Clostridium fermenticellae]|uniref:CRISPR-associated endoribonuclease Cas2 n=1 Tax=Clostridium fermenticellae TaxID=2068654 RepID=A0A386H3M7_9CLOT|nr:CRISPR-associated endonuclease Cas2 [Clostridium fermenticellae]AYD40188.1 CRISPR-associated endonuclease Cas2 [Clostridium fermenticellae]